MEEAEWLHDGVGDSVDDHPSIQNWHPNGQLAQSSWFQEKLLSRDPNLGPARIDYYESGQMQPEGYLLDNKCHRDPKAGHPQTK